MLGGVPGRRRTHHAQQAKDQLCELDPAGPGGGEVLIFHFEHQRHPRGLVHVPPCHQAHILIYCRRRGCLKYCMSNKPCLFSYGWLLFKDRQEILDI